MEKYTIKSNSNSCKILFFFVFLQKRNKMLYSIITINYNNRDGLRRTIESVVSQTYDDYEYIIIDGGSTDGSVDVIQEYADHIDYWVSEKDGGIYPAMNKGVRHAHGDYCIFMNSGDVFYYGYVLNKISTELGDEDIVVGEVYDSQTRSQLSLPPSKEITMYHLYSCAIPHQGSFIKTSLQRKYPFDESLCIAADWKFFVQTIIFDDCIIKYVKTPVALYDTTGMSSANPTLMREEKEKVLSMLFPRRVLADYRRMKDSECLTQRWTPQLRMHYKLDKIVSRLVKMFIIIYNRL